MLKLSFQYDQTAARLQVEGLPDISSNHPNGTMGILSIWRLQMVSSPQLEGKRDHLEALMATVLPYARHHLSGISRGFGDNSTPVEISQSGDRHRLLLRSSRSGIEPMAIDLDDAELADLVRCLDSLRLDPRVQIAWEIPTDQPLRRRELVERVPIRQRLAAPLLGTSVLVLAAGVGLMMPIPNRIETNPVPETTLNPPPQQQGSDDQGSDDR